MVGKPGRSGGARANSGGAREGAGAPPGSGGVREGAGRPPGTPDSTLAPARIIPTAEKWGFAEKALRHAEDMLDVLVHIAKYGESETARVSAADKVIDRAMGKAPQHFDVTAKRHADRYNKIGKLKSELAQRTIPFGPLVRNTLREWKLEYPRPFVEEVRQPHQPEHYVFPSVSGEIEHLSTIARALQTAMS